MLNKDCKKVIAALCKNLPNQPIDGYSTVSIARLSGLNENDIDRIVQYLETEGYLSSRGYTSSDFYIGEPLYFYFLTEKGKSYKIIARRKTWDYIKDKWIDFLAFVVALIALIVAIDAHIKLPPG